MFFARRSLLILAAGLAITACGDADDPTKNGNNTDPNNVTNPNNSNNDSNNGTVVDPNNTTVAPTNNNTTEPNNPPIECEVIENFYGQIGGTGDADGGAPTMEALDFDANLQAVYDAVPTTQDDSETEDVDEGRADDLSIQVTGALVTATYANTANFRSGDVRFFLQDQNTALRVYLDQGEQQTTPIKVGQRLSFTVTSTRNFGGTPQIAKISDLVVDEEGANVPYTEATGTDLTIEQFDRIVRVFGTIESDNGECGGGNKCYTFNHGDKTTTLRSRSEFLSVGGCYTYVGPVGAFPGPLATGDKTIQLDSINFNWLFELR